MLKKYKLSFDIWGLLLFLIIMIPNFIWFAIPAPNDILKSKSITETIDTVASVCQVLMIVALCIFRNRENRKICVSPFIIIIVICCLLYFFSWIVYYSGIVNAIVILGMTIPPTTIYLWLISLTASKELPILLLKLLECREQSVYRIPPTTQKNANMAKFWETF
ncbi:hypothetical protein AALD22_21405 [Lachnospiraceae bacterium 56-18]|jgi:hypothetical protein|uniref:hypothetical protein n=1 Tax=Sporofaciens sp. JLR.KK001 TaxID=3112621 RepID=UPI002FF11499